MKVLKTIQLISLLSFFTVITSCSKNSFTPTPITTSASAAGSVTLAPQVDILVVLDDTSAMSTLYSTITNSFFSFMNLLDNKNLDYHLVTIPLTTDKDPKQIGVSKYDGNNSEWNPPYPGAPRLGVNSSYFRTASTYSEFQNINSNSTNGTRIDGFQNIQTMLQRRPSLLPVGSTGSSGFLRPGALLVVILISNRYDTSGITINPGNGVPIPSQDPNNFNNFSRYLSFFQTLKGTGTTGTSLIRFYSIVGGQQAYQNQCQSLSNSSFGTSYINMAAALLGKSYDLCGFNFGQYGNPIPFSSVMAQSLTDISSQVTSQTLLFKRKFAMFSYSPDVQTIQVKINGSSIPQCSSDASKSTQSCWQYNGYKTDYVIFYPAPMNQQTGYEIEFSPSAMPEGNDNLEMNANQAGSKSTVSK